MTNLFGTILNFFNRFEIKVEKLKISTDNKMGIELCTGHLSEYIPRTAQKLIEREYSSIKKKDIRLAGTELKFYKDSFCISKVNVLEKI